MDSVCPLLQGPVVEVSRLENRSDEELMDYLRRGRQDAFSVLFDRHYRLVLSVALKILRDPGEAEDLMQEVFLDIYRKADHFDPRKGSAKIWILQYAYHRSLNRRKYLNLRRFYDRGQLTAVDELDIPASPCAWNGLTYGDWAGVIRKGLQELSEKERRTLELACFEGLLLTEIADMLKEPLPNVRNHYYRGLKKLRDFIGDRPHSRLRGESKNGRL